MKEITADTTPERKAFYSYNLRAGGSSVSLVTRLLAWRPEFDSRQGQGFILFATESRPALKSTQPLIQWMPGRGHFSGGKATAM